MSLSLVTPPTVEPVTLTQFKQHARIDRDDEDAVINGYLTAARRHVEAILRRQLLSATWRLTLDAFPCGPIYLPRPPLVSVTSVKYVDSDGVTQTLATGDYQVDTYREPAQVVAAYGTAWPVARYQPNAVEVIYVAGYGTLPTDVPQPIRQAIQLLASHWYENREPVLTGTIATPLPMAVASLLAFESFGSYP
jgi:uncharacterized phiE125 gp8 family phage protein